MQIILQMNDLARVFYSFYDNWRSYEVSNVYQNLNKLLPFVEIRMVWNARKKGRNKNVLIDII